MLFSLLRSRSLAGPEIDLWAMGCIVMEYILGRPVFGEKRRLAMRELPLSPRRVGLKGVMREET